MQPRAKEQKKKGKDSGEAYRNGQEAERTIVKGPRTRRKANEQRGIDITRGNKAFW